MNIDEYEKSNCDENATFQNTIGSFDDNKITCFDINEYTTLDSRQNKCSKFDTCSNFIDSYDCRCNAKCVSYNCGNIDECELVIDHCSFDARCYDTLGSYTCQCNSGFSGDGKTCSNMNAYTEIDFCGQNSICNDEPGSYTCDCESELKSDNGGCENINECLFRRLWGKRNM